MNTSYYDLDLSRNTSNALLISSQRPQVFSTTFVTLFLAIYAVVLMIGLFANTVTCLSMLSYRSIRQSIHIYTLNLAVCDNILILFYIPTQMVFISDQLDWKMGLVMCKIVNLVLPIILSCTIGTLVVIAFDRARGLISPFDWRADSVEMTKKTLPVIWTVSVLINIPLMVYPKVVKYGSIRVCSEGWESIEIGERFWLTMFIITYAIPLFALIIAYSLMLIFMKLHKMTMDHRRQDVKVIKMGISLLFVFAVCTGFQHVFFFITSSFSSIILPDEKLSILFVVSNFFVTLQASINPFLYGNLTLKNIRKVIKTFLPRFVMLSMITESTSSRFNIADNQTINQSNSVGCPGNFHSFPPDYSIRHQQNGEVFSWYANVSSKNTQKRTSKKKEKSNQYVCIHEKDLSRYTCTSLKISSQNTRDNSIIEEHCWYSPPMISGNYICDVYMSYKDKKEIPTCHEGVDDKDSILTSKELLIALENSFDYRETIL